MISRRQGLLNKDSITYNCPGHTSFGSLSISVSFTDQKKGSVMNDYYVSLAKDLAKGSREAFEIIYRENFESLLYFAMNFVPSREDAEDVCEDVFVKVWELRTRFAENSDIRRFMFTMVKNRCLTFLRAETRKQKREKDYIALLESCDLSEEALSHLHDDKLQVIKWINTLPENRRLIFELAIFEGLKNDEIAEKLNIALNTVKSQKGRVMRLLKLNLNSNKLLQIILVFFLSLHFC